MYYQFGFLLPHVIALTVAAVEVTSDIASKQFFMVNCGVVMVISLLQFGAILQFWSTFSLYSHLIVDVAK